MVVRTSILPPESDAYILPPSAMNSDSLTLPHIHKRPAASSAFWERRRNARKPLRNREPVQYAPENETKSGAAPSFGVPTWRICTRRK